MVLLIDGYNVLHAVGRGRDPSGRERDRFIGLVALYAQIRGHQAVIIFDGGQSAYPRQLTQDGVVVIESGYKQSADDLLCQKLPDYPPENVLVVSSDRAITDFAESHSVYSIDSPAFYRRVMDVVCKREVPAQKLGTSPLTKQKNRESKTELDLLMEKACRVVHPKAVDREEEAGFIDQKKGKKKSKAEKRLERVVKKL